MSPRWALERPRRVLRLLEAHREPCSNTVKANQAERVMKAITISAPTSRMLRRSSFTAHSSSLRAISSMSRASSSAFMEEIPSSIPMEKKVLISEEPP